MKKYLRSAFVAILAVTAFCAQAQLEFCSNNVTAGKTYTSSDFTQIKSGSFKLSSDGSELEINNLVAENDGRFFFFAGTDDITVKFIGESSLKRTGWAPGDFVFNTPDTGYRNITITGGKLTIVNSYLTGAAFMFHENAIMVFDECDITATTSSSSMGDNYSFCYCNNPHTSTTNIVEIKNSTIVGKAIMHIAQLKLTGCNFVVPKSYPYLEIYGTASVGRTQLTADGEKVVDFTIMPTAKLNDADVNHDGAVNVSDVSAVYKEMLEN